MDVITEKQCQKFLIQSNFRQYRNKALCSCSLKEYLELIEGTIYDDPAKLIEKKSMFKLLKDGTKAIGVDEAELEERRRVERES